MEKDMRTELDPVSDNALEEVSGGFLLRGGNTTLEYDPNADDTETMLLPGRPGMASARTLEKKRGAGIPLPRTTHI